jgi:hypothetical protein
VASGGPEPEEEEEVGVAWTAEEAFPSYTYVYMSRGGLVRDPHPGSRRDPELYP